MKDDHGRGRGSRTVYVRMSYAHLLVAGGEEGGLTIRHRHT